MNRDKLERKYLRERFRRVRDRLDANQANLRLQASEYERRLSELNHAHAQAEQKARDFVQMGKFDEYVKTAEAARVAALDRMMERIASLDLTRAGTVAKGAGYTALWGYIVGAVGLLLTIAQIAAYFRK